MNTHFTLVSKALCLVLAAGGLFQAAGRASAAKIYWTDRGTGKVQRANLDGSDVEDVVTGIDGAEHIAVDPIGGKVYWTDLRDINTYPKKVMRANLDGSSIEVLDELSSPTGLAIDPFDRKLYVMDFIGEGVYTFGLEDGAFEGSAPTFSNPEQLAIDLFPGNLDNLYTADQVGTSIQRFNTTERFYDDLVYDTQRWKVTSITIDSLNDKMYFVTPMNDEKIQRVNLDGSGYEVLLGSHDLEGAYAVALDVEMGKLYWTDPFNNAIHRANLDGTDEETIVTGLDDPRGITLDLLPVPEPSGVALAVIGLLSAMGVRRRRVSREHSTSPNHTIV